MTPFLRTTFLFAAMLLRAPLAPAQPAGEDRGAPPVFAGAPGLLNAVDRAVPGAEVVVLISGAADARSTPIGRTAVSFVETLLAGGQASRSWNEFAARLGWSGEETFDELLGRRVILVIRGLDDPAPAWAMLSDISLDAERRLRQRLDVAPRAVLRGHALLAVERGEYELTIARAGDRATILFGPAGPVTLFDDLLPLLADRAAVLDEPRLAHHAADQGSNSMLLYLRPRRSAGEWLAIAGSCEGPRFTARLAASPRTNPAASPSVDWSDDAWEGMVDDDTLVALAARRPSPGAGEEAPPGLAGIRLLVEARLFDLPDVEDSLGSGLALLIRHAPARPHADAPGYHAALACQLVDPRRVAPAADAFMARVFAGLGMPGHSFVGLPIEAERVVHVGDASAPAPFAVVQTRSVRWRYIVPDHADPARQNAPPTPSWWIISAGDPAMDRLARLTARAPVVAAPAADQHAQSPVVSRCFIRPAAIIDSLGASGIPIPRIGRAVAGVEHLAWTIRESPSGFTGSLEIGARLQSATTP